MQALFAASTGFASQQPVQPRGYQYSVATTSSTGRVMQSSESAPCMLARQWLERHDEPLHSGSTDGTDTGATYRAHFDVAAATAVDCLRAAG
mmetsp:Transcript_52556/g.112409  ORF Transcript_52556/g.112409 Transcript_52556/m.112409 type:complete len:92 (+) Transcript_52556:320-595(+)